MADGIAIRIEGDLAVRSLLDPSKATAAVKRGLKKGARHVQSVIREYPASPGGRPQFPDGFVSDRQRRYFFAALKSGEIKLPYKRTGGLRNSWTIEERDGGLTLIVGTNKEYAKWVQAAGFQSRYHALTGWRTEEKVIRNEAPKVNNMVNEELRKAFFRGF